MRAEWKRLAECDDFAVKGDTIEVLFPSDRRHVVEVGGDAGTWRFKAIVARAADLNAIAEQPQLLCWRINRGSSLVGYRLDSRGRLVGEAWVPQGAGADEFQFVARHLASECDRMELRLTGRDEF